MDGAKDCDGEVHTMTTHRRTVAAAWAVIGLFLAGTLIAPSIQAAPKVCIEYEHCTGAGDDCDEDPETICPSDLLPSPPGAPTDCPPAADGALQIFVSEYGTAKGKIEGVWCMTGLVYGPGFPSNAGLWVQLRDNDGDSYQCAAGDCSGDLTALDGTVHYKAGIDDGFASVTLLYLWPNL